MMTEQEKRALKFDAAMMGDVLRDAFHASNDPNWMYLLGRLDQACENVATQERLARDAR